MLSPSDFFGGLRRGLKSRLPQTYRSFEGARGHGRLLKLHLGHAFDFFRPRMVEIKARLPRAELEPWDRGWSRLYETMPASQLDESVMDRAIECLVAYITTLQPLVELFWAGTRKEEMRIGSVAR